MDRREIKLALINSGLINQDGWISTGTESSDFNDEFEQAINNIQSLFNSERLKWNKEMREKLKKLKRIPQFEPRETVFASIYNEALSDIDQLLEQLGEEE